MPIWSPPAFRFFDRSTAHKFHASGRPGMRPPPLNINQAGSDIVEIKLRMYVAHVHKFLGRRRGSWPRTAMELDLVSLSEATSGAVGAVLSNTILYPLDICKAKYQAEVTTSPDHCKYRKLSDVVWEAISKGQLGSLYQGLATKNLHSFLSQFVYFYGYTYLKRLYLSSNHTIGTRANLLLAAAAGACTAILTQPLDTASSRMQTSELGKSQGLWETLSAGSWRQAYDGLTVSLLTSNPAVQYTVFDQLKQSLLKRQQGKGVVGDSQAISASLAFVLGAVSKSIATLLTYPAIRCKVMIQASATDKEEEVEAAAGTAKGGRSEKGKGITDVLRVIWKNEGASGFFKGLRAQIFKTVLSSALLLMIKEKISMATWILILATRRRLFAYRRMLRNA